MRSAQNLCVAPHLHYCYGAHETNTHPQTVCLTLRGVALVDVYAYQTGIQSGTYGWHAVQSRADALARNHLQSWLCTSRLSGIGVSIKKAQ
jgi:hypothetical protein